MASKRIARDGRTSTLNPYVLKGMNRKSLKHNLLGGLNDFIGKLESLVPIADNINATWLRTFYNDVEGRLGPFGPMAITERHYITKAGEVDQSGPCAEAERRGDALLCGSYLHFKSFEEPLEGRLYVGWEEDRKWVKEHGLSLDNVGAVAEFVKEKVKKDGVRVAADAGLVYLCTRILMPSGIVLGAVDAVRGVRNAVSFDSHWTLELTPGKKAKFTGDQYNAYAALVHEYSKK